VTWEKAGTVDNSDLTILSVFISYSNADSGLVDSLVAVFDELGVKYFRDARDIRLGELITAKVGEALAECRLLLVIISPNSLKSHWVPYEIGQASALRKVIVPFLTDPSVDVPAYVRDLSYATTVEQIRRYFIEGGPDKATITRDDTAPQPQPFPASPERRPVLKREQTAEQVLATIFRTIYQSEQETTFESLYQGRWVKWTAKLDNDPRRGYEDWWFCNISEEETRALIVAKTHQDLSDFRLWDRVEVEGKIDKYEGEGERYSRRHGDKVQRIHLVNAVIRTATQALSN
jgi:hypothetical protein